MEIKPIQVNNTISNKQFCAKKVITNPYSGAKRELELPNINSTNCTLKVEIPQNYKNINTFEIPHVGKAYFYRLQNGQKVIIVPTDGETVVKTHVNVGSMNEPDNLRGISHYIEHNLFNGTETLEAGEFFKKTNQMGAKTNASTGFAKTDYFIATHILDDNDLEKTIKLHADMIENPAFKEEQLIKEKGPIISEIAMVLDNDENLATNRAIKNLYQINSTSTDIIAGEAKNIEALTREDVLNYYHTWYTPDNLVTVVTGEVNPQETIKLLANSFKKSAVSTPRSSHFETFNPIENSIREDLISDKSSSSKIVMATVGPKNSDAKENIKAEALLTYLIGYQSSVLKEQLAKNGISVTGNIERMSNSPNQSTAMLLFADANPKYTEQTIKTMYNIIENIYNNPPEKEDMEAVKNNMLKNHNILIKNSNELNNFVAHGFLNCNMLELSNTEAIINSLTAEDIQAAAKKYLDLNKTSIVVSHPANLGKGDIIKNYQKVNKSISFGCSQKDNTKLINTNSIKQIILPNNMSLFLENSKSDLSVGQIVLKAQLPQNINPIAPYILSEMLANGHNEISSSDFKKEMDKKAVELNFSVTDKGISATTTANGKDLDFAISNLQKTLQNPKLDENNFQQAKQKALNVILSSTNSSYDYAMKELFANNPKFGLKADYIKALQDIKLDDIKDIYAYISNNASAYGAITTSNTGVINQNSDIIKTLSKFEKNFKDYEFGDMKTYKPQNEAKIITHIQEQKQADIVQIYSFEQGNNLKDTVSVDLLNMVLGATPSSRLFSDLREKQKLAYRVNSAYEKYENTGMIKLRILTTTEDKDNNIKSFDNVQKSLDGFEKHVELLKSQKVSEEELNGVKRFLKSRIMEIKDSQVSKNASLLTGTTKHEGLDYYNKYVEMIDKITPDDIYNAANYVFKNPPLTSIVASKNTVDTLNK